jgi:hypothetical protein
VDNAGVARHYPGMPQQSLDEEWRPPGFEQYVNRKLHESRKTNVEM